MSCNVIDIVEVKVIKDHILSLKFQDGKEGKIDIAKMIDFVGIFEPLKNKEYFAQVYVNSDIGTICWENGADISPVFLYKNISDDQEF